VEAVTRIVTSQTRTCASRGGLVKGTGWRFASRHRKLGEPCGSSFRDGLAVRNKYRAGNRNARSCSWLMSCSSHEREAVEWQTQVD